MSITKNTEMLSRLMDGEWQDLDPADSVRDVYDDDALRETWSRYHLIRDVIRNEELNIDRSLSARISAAIDDEPAFTNVASIGQRHQSASVSESGISDTQGSDAQLDDNAAVSQRGDKRTWYTGAAIAACMALATVVGLNVYQGAPGNGPANQTVAGVGADSSILIPDASLPQVELVSNKGTYWVTPDAKRNREAEERLNMFLSQHIENSPTASRMGMIPYSRLVGYDAAPQETAPAQSPQ